MIPASFVVLHGGSILEITFLGYLFLVVLYLFAFGGIAVIVFEALGVVSVIYSRVVEKCGTEKNDL